MYIQKYLFCLTALLINASSVRSDSINKELVDAIAHDVTNAAVSRVAVFFMPYDTRTFGAVTPEVLKHHLLLTTNLTPEIRASLAKALRETQARQSRTAPDLRWGAHLLSKDEKILHSIFLDRTGTGAILDGDATNLNRPLLKWFERNFYRKSH